MENKRYLDKVVGSLVRGTKINYEKEVVYFPFRPSLLFPLFTHIPSSPPQLPSFSSYCRNYFGLTKDEIRYIWKEYKNIINGKIENGE